MFDMHKWKKWKDNLENKDCLHNNCTDCDGTGKKKDGSSCVHTISCPCSKCTPTYY